MTLENKGAEELIRFLFEIKKRTLLLLSEKSYTQLHCITLGFIFGYNNAVNDSVAEHLDKVRKNNTWTNFRNYFGAKYNVPLSDVRKMVEYFGGEEEAFYAFFEGLENFLKENNIGVPEIE